MPQVKGLKKLIVAGQATKKKADMADIESQRKSLKNSAMSASFYHNKICL